MDDIQKDHPFEVELVYAKAHHAENMFETGIYSPQAKLWLYNELAELTIKVAQDLHTRYGWISLLKDGLRTTTAQALMLEAPICKQNPQWFEAPRLLSPPGRGAHPRGMAIDIDAKLENGTMVNFGTVFDALPADKSNNPADRSYTNFPEETKTEILDNRDRLTQSFLDNASKMGIDIVPLPNEWWDYRYPQDVYEQFAPLSDDDLPAHIKLCEI